MAAPETGYTLGNTWVLAGTEGAVHEVFVRACGVVARSGADRTWARRMPGQLMAAGAVDVEACLAETPMAGAGNPMAGFLTLSLEQLTPLLVASGVPEDLPAAACAELAEPGRWQPVVASVVAWGRRPD